MNGIVFESFQNMSSEYDIVLIDAAPILLSAETEYLARMADVTVLVIEAGKTKKAWLTRAARLLERLVSAGAQLRS
jgi:succinoglycan biosynthesis transport protein ExoP